MEPLLETENSKNIPALAAHCLRAIRSRQLHGPYYLAGHSFGGFVALEIAQQIRSAGERVGFLGLIDTAVLSSQPNISAQPDDQEARYVARVLHYLYRLPITPGTTQYALSATEELEAVVRDLQQQKLMPSGFKPMQAVQRARAAFSAMATYNIPIYSDPVTLFRASETFPYEYFGEASRGAAWNDPFLGWRPFLAGLETVPIPGNHLTAVQPPYAAELAQFLRCALEQAHTRSLPMLDQK
jgi:thioesterase domain-containing protein